jgi:hypothetical protein
MTTTATHPGSPIATLQSLDEQYGRGPPVAISVILFIARLIAAMYAAAGPSVRRQILDFLRHAVAREMRCAPDAPFLNDMMDALEENGLGSSVLEPAATSAPPVECHGSRRDRAATCAIPHALRVIHAPRAFAPMVRAANPRRDLDPRLRGPPMQPNPI